MWENGGGARGGLAGGEVVGEDLGEVSTGEFGVAAELGRAIDFN